MALLGERLKLGDPGKLVIPSLGRPLGCQDGRQSLLDRPVQLVEVGALERRDSHHGRGYGGPSVLVP